jgi:methyltransferase family protein
VSELTLDLVVRLYREHAAALRIVREAQKRLYAQRSDARLERFAPYRWTAAALRGAGLPAHYKRRFRPKFDDIEAELTYLFVRSLRPAVVLEIAPYYGWSTTWLLHALRDNGAGRLYSYDLVGYSRWTMPPQLTAGRWFFTQADVRTCLDRLPRDVGYLFLDAAHTAEFARWYLDSLFPRLAPGAVVGVHDVVRGDLPPMDESLVLRDWLEQRGVPSFTAAPGQPGGSYQQIVALKQELGLAEPIHDSLKNPMIFFRLP